ncbi:GNAT family N-acetyltransferase [Brevibacterium album]|uniref:GNAT family N-acetyltransferase n=1 Tax=Brevibacterium album TaxID=417948 RepID=UPI000417621B|nr:GNAT family N-acetyltransferase [Brevibacterium album]
MRFWCDDAGPVAGFVLEARKETWECAPLWSPDLPGPALAEVWACAQETAAAHAAQGYGVLVRDDDTELGALVRASGLVPGDGDATAWMPAAERPEAQPLPAGLVLTDRTQRADAPHPLRHLNGAAVESRMRQCSLYAPELDLSVESEDGRLAGYAVFWHDPVTKVGLVEPVRVMEGFRRRGVARVLLAEGIARLAARGAERIKISYETEAAGALYLSLGFVRESRATWHRWKRPGST